MRATPESIKPFAPTDSKQMASDKQIKWAWYLIVNSSSIVDNYHKA